MTRALRLAGLLLGVALVAWLVAQADLATLLGALSNIGWGFTAILAVRGATILTNAAAWHCLIPGGERPPFRTTLSLRWIGEAINTTLPAAQIGGDIVRARLMQRRLPGPARGAASVAVDFFLSLLAQILFTLLGFVLLAWLSRDASWWPVAIGAVLLPVFAVFSWELLVRRRLLAALERVALRLGWQRAAGSLQALGEGLVLVARSRTALAVSLSLHVTSFLGHAAELWLTLYLMAAPVGFAAAVMLESISFAARSVAFLIPSGWGAQEIALVGLAGVAGLSPETALALGLVKRAREFAIGLPGLVAWAIAEHRRPAAQPD